MCSQVRKTKDTSIQETASAMQYGAIIELEEQALVMELATGTPMEIHYDLVAHDDALSEIQRSAKVQSDSIDAPDEAEEADGSKVEVLQRHAAGNACRAGERRNKTQFPKTSRYEVFVPTTFRLGQPEGWGL